MTLGVAGPALALGHGSPLALAGSHAKHVKHALHGGARGLDAQAGRLGTQPAPTATAGLQGTDGSGTNTTSPTPTVSSSSDAGSVSTSSASLSAAGSAPSQTASSPSATTSSPTSTPTTTTAATGTYGIYGLPFDKEPADQTREASVLASTTSATDRALLEKVFSASPARWYGHHNTDVAADVSHRVTNAASRNAIATLVAYNIPYIGCRDTGVTATAYRQWIDQFTAGLGTHKAIVIVEPDALAHIDCLTAAQQTERLSLLRYAVSTIAAQGSWAYLDAGNSIWLKAGTIASRLESAGVGHAAGFSLNVSNFRSNAETIPYGQAISKLVGDKHFVIDTSRNGLNPDSTAWCNPPNRGLGVRPTIRTGAPEVDAYLWVKPPGQSDGSCNGGQYGGAWLQDYALMLARNAAF